MKKSVKTKWVKALRSGKYKQASYGLKLDGGFCCLGVLCDISKLGKWDNRGFYCTHGSTDNEHLPEQVYEWAGLDSYSPVAGGEELAVLNDQGKTFAEIADIIEEQL